MQPEKELPLLEKQLSDLYRSIADKYRQTSSVKDEYKIKKLLSGIDADLVQSTALRVKIEALHKLIAG